MPLLALPPELLDAILDHLPAPADLAALALTCASLAALSAPHLSHRVVRAKLSHTRVWARLARAGGARVRSLTVLPERAGDLDRAYAADLELAERIPPFACTAAEGHGQEGHAERLLISAIRAMPALAHFRWLRAPPPALHGAGDVWDTLNALGTLEQLHVLDQPEGAAAPIVRSETFLRIRGLTGLKIRTSALDANVDAGALLGKMLVPARKLATPDPFHPDIDNSLLVSESRVAALAGRSTRRHRATLECRSDFFVLCPGARALDTILSAHTSHPSPFSLLPRRIGASVCSPQTLPSALAHHKHPKPVPVPPLSLSQPKRPPARPVRAVIRALGGGGTQCYDHISESPAPRRQTLDYQ
ncbi:hypothetical protein GLOTRDRAFT_134020 [Gloeophyllum trabeum ATCC 11539]|uniref:F-box domain-containing protein n=1 Tax=Gloeophyllum trabeum (strain ATCC 11539 / FP-39264 / Madison 617) TaxID=670483 RepID=S7PSI7_GLOTA|nr:uncharacterized protein GLOTRDRAFT_134020 [Gloeophyllum trabeum ATCC 11539]EPQ50352.1 hypothetical protein GLOTRDRAFT_134020 [Gloeophyllum trabeum ATCC 11539]